jgi:HK97 gp10 family phage protein
MAAQTGVTIKVISNKIPALPAALRKQVVDQVARSTFDVEARAKQLSPVLTGTLRRSIHSVFTNGGLTGICGPSVDYSIFVEMGTRRMAARPYMRPAAELVLPKFADELKRILAGLG